MDTISLAKRHRKSENLKNGFIKIKREYIDFIVSGKSLEELLKTHELDLIGNFGWSENKEYENKQIDEFLGKIKPELETGRTCFYVCPECGNIACGAITAKIEITNKSIIWKDFGYENNDSEPDLTIYKNIGPFTFDKLEFVNIFEYIKLNINTL